LGEDRVALDHTAWQMIATQARRGWDCQRLRPDGRPPNYIITAADGAHLLGTNDPQRIHLLEV
jgi:hypothetical protein